MGNSISWKDALQCSTLYPRKETKCLPLFSWLHLAWDIDAVVKIVLRLQLFLGRLSLRTHTRGTMSFYGQLEFYSGNISIGMNNKASLKDPNNIWEPSRRQKRIYPDRSENQPKGMLFSHKDGSMLPEINMN